MNHAETSSSEGQRASTATSRSLVQRLQADDPHAWDLLVDLYAPLVFLWCRRWDLPEQEIADIAQDVFQAVAAHIGGFRKERAGDTFRGWLRVIAQNKVRDHHRKRGHEPGGVGGTEAQLWLASLTAPEENESSEVGSERGLFLRALELIRGEFEERTWQAFWMTTVEDRPAKVVALDLNMTPGAVRVAKSRVLRRLREELGDAP